MEQLLKDGQYIEFFVGELALHCRLSRCPPAQPIICPVSPSSHSSPPSLLPSFLLQRGLARAQASPSTRRAGSSQCWWTLLWKVGGAGASGGQARELCFRRPHISAGTIPDIYIVPVDVSYDKVCGVLVR